MMSLASALAAALARHVDHSFVLMGNGNAHLIDALGRIGVPVTPVRHEAATVASADAYARITTKLALASTSYGAGFTNTLTALAEAAQARTPLLLVVGDAPTTGPRPWDIDQELAAISVGVRSYPVDPEHVDSIVDRAAGAAYAQRRPVVLAIPYDRVTATVTTGLPDTAAAHSSGQEANLNHPDTIASLAAATVGHPNSSASFSEPPHLASPGEPKAAPGVTATPKHIAAAVRQLAAAERPLVLAGRGAWLAGAQAELAEIAQHLGALTATTALGRGLFAEPRYDLGIAGGFGYKEAMRVVAEADVVLVVGAGLNQFTMRFGELFGEGTAVIRVDCEEVAAPKSVYAITHHLLPGDARNILALLLQGLNEHSAAAAGSTAAAKQQVPWRERVAGLEPGGVLRQHEQGVTHPDGLCEDGRLDPRAVAVKLATLLPERRQLTSDGGHFIGWANMFWSVDSPQRAIMVGTAYQTIGLGLATVAGAAAAAPDHTIVLTTGDGGALMALADLETAIRTTRSCVIVVWNDGAYGAEVHLYGAMGLDQSAMRIPDVNFAGMASALGATGVRVDRLTDLEALEQWKADGAVGTILLDCRISRSVVAPYQREVQKVNGLKLE